ncbi:MAG: class I SAM-dependent methyltransferase [Gemmatimonadetes bacterium]|nr:class I SAM-dependent methyltransferase [Gemmatimonadota bacterium]
MKDQSRSSRLSGEVEVALTARMEPFDSFWEAPEDIEAGYDRFARFYTHNYLPHVPDRRDARILVISCGPGYFVKLLIDRGYTAVSGIDSFPEKIEHAVRKGLPCETAEAFPFLETSAERFDLIICEQELNHLTKQEILDFFALCRKRLAPGGRIILHAINGATPLTGSESRHGNFDHYCSFTEYSLAQVLEYGGFENVEIYGLNLYVFWTNPLNYVALAIDRLWTWFFRLNFRLVGKDARIFSKKIGAVGTKPA